MSEQFRKYGGCSFTDPSLSFHSFYRINKKRPEAHLRLLSWAEFSYTNCSRCTYCNGTYITERGKRSQILQSVPTNYSPQTEVLELLSSRDMSEEKCTPNQVPGTGTHNWDNQKFQELTPKEKLINMCRRSLQKICDLKNKREQQKNLNQTTNLVNNDDLFQFSVPTNYSSQTEALSLFSSRDMSEDQKCSPKLVPETEKHYLDNDIFQEVISIEKLLKICRRRLRRICDLKYKWKHKTNQIQKLVNNDDVRKLFEYQISDSLVIILQSQIKYYTKKPRRRRYNLEEQILALPLYKKSPARYRLLRRFFSLPCQSTLNKLVRRVPLDPGVNRQIFIGLADMVQVNDTNENICTLVFNDMNLKRSRGVTIKALVFMLSGVEKNWKQPLAYYMLDNYTTVDLLVVVIREVLQECFKVGLNVVATVCKPSAVNIRLLEFLGSTKEKPYFDYEQYEIVTILDPPHLLKCFRDLFMEHDVLYCSDVRCRGVPSRATAKWSHVETFYEIDKMNPNLVFAPAVTDVHIYPNNKHKTRVKLAAQTFSHSMAVGIIAKSSSHELPAEAIATANFLYRVDELFDALNADSKDSRRGKIYSTNLTKNSPHLEYLQRMKIFIREMRFLGSDTTAAQEGWMRTITAVELLWQHLHRLGVTSLATRRLNLDVLENCFASIRYSCGSNFLKPSVSQFVAGIKTAVITNLNYSGRNKNCEDDTLVMANNLQAFLSAGGTQSNSTLGSCEHHP